jgi:hypothetical protein
MRRRILLILPLILLGGCTVARDADFVEPGTVCEIIPWKPSWSTHVNEQAEIATRNGAGALLQSGTRVAVLGEVPPRDTRIRNTKIPQNVVHVLDGPYKGSVGVVFRPHLRITSEPKRVDLVNSHPTPAKPAGSESEAKRAESPSPNEEAATPKRADAAEPAPNPEKRL